MNLVKKYFSGKRNKNIFKTVFSIAFTVNIIGTVFYTNMTHTIAIEPGINQTEEEENDELNLQIETTQVTAGVSAYLDELCSLNIKILEKENDFVQQSALNESTETTNNNEETEIELETTEEPIVEEVKPNRKNALYYILDEGYTFTLETEYQDYLYEMCEKYDVTEYYELLLAQMYHESSYDKDVISYSNDYGLMQINECNHEYLSKKFGKSNFLDPYLSIECGVFFMSDFLHKYNDVQKALVCYNKGESAVINGTYSTEYSKCVVSDIDLLVEIK